MKLFLISQKENKEYDTYDSAVVAAPSEDIARNMHPCSDGHMIDWENERLQEWCWNRDSVTVRYLGEATDEVEQGTICSSFNAG